MELNENLDKTFEETKNTLEESFSLFVAKKDERESKMKSKYLSFWVFSINGPVLFSSSHEISINPDLIGGFFSAIRAFSFEILNNEISYIAIGGENLIFYTEPEKRYYIVGCIDNKIRVDYAKRRLKQIFCFFDSLYGKYFKNHNKVNIKRFKNFKAIIEHYELDYFKSIERRNEKN